MILIADNVIRPKEKLAAASTALRDTEITINDKKTKIITIAGNKKLCQTALNEETLGLKDQTISSLSPTDQFSYLGIPFTWKGKVAVNHRLEVNRQLSGIRKAPLKPCRRMEILRFYPIPKMMHSLTLGQVHRNTPKRLDTTIRQAVRAWLRLPNNTPPSYFHTAVLKGGIGVPCLSSTVPFLKRSRFEKLLVSQVSILRNVVTDSSFGPILRNMNIPLRVQGITVSSQEETQGAWCEHLYNSNDGRGLQEAAGSPLSSRWLLSPASVFPSYLYTGNSFAL